MKKFLLVCVSVTLLLIPAFLWANEATEEDAKRFFEKYVKLGENFDESVAELYADSAKIKMNRLYPNGQMRKMELDGAKWKPLVKQSMPLGKTRGDISKFSEIKITVNGKRVKIKANRFSVIKCYVDKGYYMIIEKDNKGIYRIIEEYMETQPQSDC
jgi:hypothetical protein